MRQANIGNVSQSGLQNSSPVSDFAPLISARVLTHRTRHNWHLKYDYAGMYH